VHSPLRDAADSSTLTTAPPYVQDNLGRSGPNLRPTWRLSWYGATVAQSEWTRHELYSRFDFGKKVSPPLLTWAD